MVGYAALHSKEQRAPSAAALCTCAPLCAARLYAVAYSVTGVPVRFAALRAALRLSCRL